jgi:hypothetical protein
MVTEHDGSHEALENFFKEGIMLVTQYVKHHKAQRIAEQTEASRRDHELKINGRQERFQQELSARLGLDQAKASLQYANVNNEEWWQTSDAVTILDTYKGAAMNADNDPHAAAAVEVMSEYMKAHMGIDVDAINKGTEAMDISDELHGDKIDEAYEDHIDRGRDLKADNDLASLEQQFDGNADVDELTAGLRELQLSQALTAAASPHTIDQVANAAEADAEAAQARHTSPDQDLAGERDNLDR